MKIGFIGLGNMGGGLAKNLLRAGKEVLLFDLNQDAIKAVMEAGNSGKIVKDIKEFSEVDILFTSLPLPKHVEDVLIGENGVVDVLKPDSICIDVSTIDPQTSRKVADYAEAKEIGFLECPLGKGPKQAAEGTEPIYAGGKKEIFEKVKDVLSIVGNPVYYCGEVEASAAIKLLSNLIGMTNVAVIAEGILIGEKAGIDKDLLMELLKDSGANGYQLELRGPFMLNKDFANRFGVDLALKDVRLGYNMAKAMGIDPKMFETAFNYYNEASVSGYGKEDCSAVYKVVKTN